MADPDRIDLAVDAAGGRVLGQYTLVRRLGRGGMGEVFEAVDARLDRRVAIKVLPAEVLSHPTARQRFRREARAAARLTHPNVITVHGIEDDERPFIVMELARGGSLAEAVRARGRLPWEVATRHLIDACRGVAAAHRVGLVHRDLKPANLLLTADDVVKVADFGLARLVAPTATLLTAAHAVVGTAAYMSPEQCRGDEPVTDLADVYALGATYYTLLTGRPPYERPTEVQLQFAHCSAPVPDPRDVCPDVPAGCADLVRRAMAKEPAERFPSATVLLTGLESVLVPGSTIGRSGPTLSPPRPRPSRRRVVVGLMSAGTALAAGAVYRFGGAWFAPHKQDGDDGSPAVPSVTPGWTALFDGRSTSGWEQLKPLGGSWSVVNGWLEGEGRGKGAYLYTRKSDFRNFRLRVVGRIPGGKNSGVYVRCTPADGLPFGYEAQLGWDDGKPSFGKVFGLLPDNIYPGAAPDQQAVRVGPDADFTLEVDVTDLRIATRVNGVAVVDFRGPVQMPVDGRIGLQALGEGVSARFRTIEIQELPP